MKPVQALVGCPQEFQADWPLAIAAQCNPPNLSVAGVEVTARPEAVKVTKMNSKRSDKIESFVIADVRGDGRDDVLVPSGTLIVSGWKISDDGRSDLKKLDIGGMRGVQLKPAAMLRPRWFWGRFDDKPGADALALEPRRIGWIASGGHGELKQYGAYAR